MKNKKLNFRARESKFDLFFTERSSMICFSDLCREKKL